jgi:dipeptidyl aminopeptidase/acylaminoacyl peptidase
MTDLVIDYETTRPDLRPYSAEMMGGTPEQVPERYRERSPVHALGQITGQLLIVQGMRDPNVTPQNVTIAATELQRTGVEYQILPFEDEGHGIQQLHNQRILYRQLAEFFLGAFGA